ncbi:hypothetical protein CAXC1_320017 [Candidatus Xenohaliotis californiensis]|uniref:Zinc finger CHCC-type domain-containing protein n=1 Tax=Candidatus Xenohaliotis californiensis TaxID=84677 RepID=A0ABM9N8B2_9RICK|nr:hypothetical protein CAXC1_320017 [Candidatus Xenohaliotis californiensis]
MCDNNFFICTCNGDDAVSPHPTVYLFVGSDGAVCPYCSKFIKHCE